MARATPYSDRKQCIELCLDCYRSCIDAAMTHCLEADGEHAEPMYLRLCEQCAANCAGLGAPRPVQLEPVLTHPRARSEFRR